MGNYKMDKLINKENILIVVAVIIILIQSNYFATKLDVANLKNELLKTENALKEYSDKGDKELLQTLDNKLQLISNKIDKLK